MRSVNHLAHRGASEGIKEKRAKEKDVRGIRPLVNEDGLFAPADPAQHSSIVLANTTNLS